MDDSDLSKLLQQLNKSDVDAKIDAVTKLQAEFENGVDIPEPDVVIQAFKACLRISNQHLQTATLSALLHLLPLVVSHGPARSYPAADILSTSSSGSASIDMYVLRQVLNAFLPQGGIIDRLGDARERSRDKARETLVIIGGYAFRAATGSTLARSRDAKSESPLQAFERYMRESALGSKVWRVREQALLALVDIRRAHHLFPIRPYLPLLVGTLEDSDANVRETARTAIVELFTGPGVTDAARADLKKELTKKGVRKTIVDSVLERILSRATEPPAETNTNANGDAPKAYIPPSLALQARKQVGPGGDTPHGPAPSGSRSVSVSSVASRQAGISRIIAPDAASMPGTPMAETTAEVDTVYVASGRDLEVELTNMFKAFEGKETEHNWAARDRTITRIRGMLKGEVHHRYSETFLTYLKPIIDVSLKTLASLRTTVVTNTTNMYNELAMALGPALDPVVETMLLNLLKMAGFVKKITAQASQGSVTTILTYTTPSPRVVITLLSNALQDKTPQGRAYAADHLNKYLEQHGARARHAIESMGMLDPLDRTLRRALADANPSARQAGRVAFWAFEAVWPDRAQAILEAQDSTNRKAIEKASPRPNAQPEASTSNTAAPAAKKSSIAAAIAASRAKAKAIANAPPTLRHQATSAARTISPQKRSMSPSLSTGSSGSPPLSPRSRIASGPAPRPQPPKPAPRLSHSRNSSSDSAPSTSHRPVSPHMPAMNLPPRGSTFRRAIQTALPASPPAPATTITPPSPSYRRPVHLAPQPYPDHRTSLALLSGADYSEASLLTAVAIPLPDESDSDMELDDPTQPLSFATPYEREHQPTSSPRSRASFSPRSPRSQSHSSSARPLNNALSTGSPPAGAPVPLVEDALRARAEQAQSAAERLLELVEPEDDHEHAPAQGLLLQSNAARAHGSPVFPSVPPRAPVTPAAQKTSSVWRQAAAFQDSPQWAGPSGSPVSLMTDVLRPAMVPAQTDSPWWRKRMALMNRRSTARGLDNGAAEGTLREIVDSLNKGTADAALLQRAALFCAAHPALDPLSPLSASGSFPASPSPFLTSPPGGVGGVWAQDKSFARLFSALRSFLQPERDEEMIEYGLIVLWEMLESQAQLMEGREADVFAILLRIRYCGKQSVLGATNVVRDALAARVDAVYGLTTMHANLLAFAAEAPPVHAPAEAKAATYAYGLIALGKFILRLPDEILEEELPRLKGTLIAALNDASSLVVRESAASAIIAAQLVLRDETHLFALLDGLADDKKNLLTYLFDKHAVRGPAGTGAGMDRLEREMRRLDGRTATPPRPAPRAR